MHKAIEGERKGTVVVGRYVDATWPSDPGGYAPPRYRAACRYRAFVPDLLDGLRFDYSPDLAAVVSDAERKVAELNAHGSPVLEPLARLLLRTESIASSKVEGLSVDARDLARADSVNDAGGKVSNTAIEVLGNVAAMQAAMETAATVDRFRLDDVIHIHRTLLDRSPNRSIAGVVRAQQNWIGGNDYNPCEADFVPPPHGELAELLDDVVAAISRSDQPPVVQAALVHAQFETIHPFIDGNGRTGRALIQVVLRRRGLAPRYVPPVSVVLAANRDRYIQGLTEFRDGDVAGWVEMFAVALARACDLTSTYLARIKALQEHWRSRLRSGDSPPRSDAAVWAVIDAIPAIPVLSTATATAATGRSRPAVEGAIQRLVDDGVLIPVSAGRRNRLWESPDVLAAAHDLDIAAAG